MSRLTATLRTDVRTQLRNGFYYAAAFVAVSSIVLLRWLPADTARLLLPVAVLENVLVNTFYFAGGLLLLERVEGSFVAQAVTPLRPHEYLAAKLATLTLLSLLESLSIAVAVLGVGAWLVPMALGIVLAALLLCLAGVAFVARYDTVNEFLLPSALFTAVLSLPVLGVFGIGSPAWYVLHPLSGPLALMQIDATRSAAELAWSLAWPLLWLVPAYRWSRSELDRLRCA